MSEKNIYQRLAAATAEMETVAKNLTVQTGKNGSYKAAGERDVLDAVKKVEAKYGIYSYPSARKIVESDALESEGYDGKKKTTFFLRVETTYRFINIDKPEEYIEVVGYGDGMDSGDKATGKAVTYSDKYCLMKAYKISTGDDPDKDASEDRSYRTKAGKPAKKEELVAPKEDAKDEQIDAVHAEAISRCIARKGLNPKSITDYYKVNAIEDLNMEKWMNAMKLLEKYKDVEDGSEGQD